jgi:hypothetical protein
MTITTQKQNSKMPAAMPAPIFRDLPVPGRNSMEHVPSSVREVSSGNSAGRELSSGEFDGDGSGSCGCIGSTYNIRSNGTGRPTPQQPVHRGNKNQGRKGGEQQAADDRPAERCVLLAAFSDA